MTETLNGLPRAITKREIVEALRALRLEREPVFGHDDDEAWEDLRAIDRVINLVGYWS